MPLKQISNGWFVLEENESEAEDLLLTQQPETPTPHEDIVELQEHIQNKRKAEVVEVSDSHGRSSKTKRKAEVIELSSGDEADQQPRQTVRRNVTRITAGRRRQEVRDALAVRDAMTAEFAKRDRRKQAAKPAITLKAFRTSKKKEKEKTQVHKKSLEYRLQARKRELAAESEERGRQRAAKFEERKKELEQLEQRRVRHAREQQILAEGLENSRIAQAKQQPSLGGQLEEKKQDAANESGMLAEATIHEQARRMEELKRRNEPRTSRLAYDQYLNEMFRVAERSFCGLAPGT
ncbi:MAG: hypothetical protein L6R42_007725 [Xanthoria sp. 1 TBL-2021]|nr:MAG: hypothetical protein L6R42_007725 [Xanthoria sp. 1 TBL-2021]